MKINQKSSVTVRLRYCVQSAMYSGQNNPSIKRVLSSSKVTQHTRWTLRHKIERNNKYEIFGLCEKLYCNYIKNLNGAAQTKCLFYQARYQTMCQNFKIIVIPCMESTTIEKRAKNRNISESIVSVSFIVKLNPVEWKT